MMFPKMGMQSFQYQLHPPLHESLKGYFCGKDFVFDRDGYLCFGNGRLILAMIRLFMVFSKPPVRNF